MTYWKAKLIIKDKLHKTELFESVEKARLWSMKEAKLTVSDTPTTKQQISYVEKNSL